MKVQDTIVALATAPGTAAIAVIRLSGEDALQIAAKVFKPLNKNLQFNEIDANSVTLGHLYENERLIDEVLMSKFIAPRSYTGEHVIEFSCHGSQFIQQAVIQLLIKNGARMADAGEFTMRAFLNAKMDLSQAEAVGDLIAGESEAAHRVALEQMRGGFSKELSELRRKLLETAALLELELDFSGEDVEFANRDELRETLQQMQAKVRRLIDSYASGNAIKNGIPVAIIGEPNVGKSTLLNTLLNEEKAIVSEIAGTTRDSIEDELIIQGIKFRFVDTAGLRETTDTIEKLGIERSYDKAVQSRLILFLIDASQMLTAEDRRDQLLRFQLLKERFNDVPVALILNKTDTLLPVEIAEIREFLEQHLKNTPYQMMSARQDEDVEALKLKLLQTVQAGVIVQDEKVVTSLRHYSALLSAQEALIDVQVAFENDLSSDLIAIDLKRVTDSIGLITGEVAHDELLGFIFSEFCIGK